MKVSIITPSFNRADIIHDTAQSVFNQTYTNWEWVIVDDGSTDNSIDVLQGFAKLDSRVKVFRRDRAPKGACTCRNIAVEKSSGDYLIFLDTDDLLTSFCLEQRVKALAEHPECDFIIFPMLLFKTKIDDTRLLWNIPEDRDDIERILIGDPICQGTGTLWKKESFIKIGMWGETLLLWQDIELHLRSLISGLIYEKRFDLYPDVFIRISEVSLSRTGYHSLPKLLSRMRVLISALELSTQNLNLERYTSGFRFMFIDIFHNALISGYQDQLKYLVQMQMKYSLFSSKEYLLFKNIIFIYKYKLNKIEIISAYIEKKLKNLAPHKQQTTLNKIFYSQPIIF